MVHTKNYSIAFLLIWQTSGQTGRSHTEVSPGGFARHAHLDLIMEENSSHNSIHHNSVVFIAVYCKSRFFSSLHHHARSITFNTHTPQSIFCNLTIRGIQRCPMGPPGSILELHVHPNSNLGPTYADIAMVSETHDKHDENSESI